MNKRLTGRTAFASLAFLVVGMVLLMISTTHAGASGSGTLDACINPGNGMMRLVSAGTPCHANETRVEWNIAGPQGPQGPPGPAGSSAGGPPFVWVCTPANYDLGGSGNNSDIDVFNASSTTANVAVHFLAADGTNISGGVIPGSNPAATYPGQTGNTTVPLAPQNTMILNYLTGSGTRANNSALLTTVTVTSDQPIVVGYNIPFGALQATPCSLAPK